MKNLNWLYKTNDEFRESVRNDAMAWLDNTSTVFAGKWLEAEHGEKNDFESLEGQHADTPEGDVDSREKLEADVNAWCATFPTWNHADDFREHVFGWLDRQVDITADKIQHDVSIAARESGKVLREKAVELQAFAERLELAASSGDDVTLFDVDYVPQTKIAEMQAKNQALADRVDYWQTAWKDVCAERDAYRELCGKLRKAAQDMAAWEVDE